MSACSQGCAFHLGVWALARFGGVVPSATGAFESRMVGEIGTRLGHMAESLAVITLTRRGEEFFDIA